MDVGLYSPEYIIKCKYCDGYISHSAHIKNIQSRYQFGIKIKHYMFEPEYCLASIGSGKVFCGYCHKIIGTVDHSRNKSSLVQISNIRFCYEVFYSQFMCFNTEYLNIHNPIFILVTDSSFAILH